MNLDGRFKEIVLFLRPGELTSSTKEMVREVELFANKMKIELHHAHRGYVVTHNSLFVAIGGDGTMLGAMRAAVEVNTAANKPIASVIGFNAGHLGFLTEDVLDVEIFDMLYSIYGFYSAMVVEERMVLETTFDGVQHFAVNEFVFTADDVSAPLNYEILINNDHVAKHMGSGVLISTATGSTAQALSAGGSIIHPSTNVMEIVPLMPHTLTSRPIVTTGRDTITIRSQMERVWEVHISADGCGLRSFSKDDNAETKNVEIVIKRADWAAKIWHKSDRNFFDVLSTKLKW